MFLILSVLIGLANAADSCPALERLWLQRRAVDTKTMPVPVDFGAGDLHAGWPAEWDDLALRWGQGLYVAFDFLHRGHPHAAEGEKHHLLATLAEINCRAKSRDEPDVAGDLIKDVFAAVVRKIGFVDDAERASDVRFFGELVDLAAQDELLIESGRRSVAIERNRVAQKNLVDGTVTAGTISVLGAMITSFFQVVQRVEMGAGEMTLFYGGSVAAGVLGALILRDPLPEQSQAGDPNQVLDPLRSCADHLAANAPAAAARPSGASPAE